MIPIIDLGPLFSNTTRGIQEVAAQLYQIYSTLGFAQVINHKIPRQTIENLYIASRDFHELKQEEKNKVKFKGSLRGYQPMNTLTIRNSELGDFKKPDLNESFLIRNEIPLENKWYKSPVGGKQPWPAELPEFKNQVLDYFNALQSLSQLLMQTFAVAMDLPMNALDQYFTEPHILLRLVYYPPAPKDAPADLYGAAPHTDSNCITLLHQDKVGGLQVKSSDEQWLDVPPRQDAFVLNTGKIMSIWSNDRLKATPHRVINPDNSSRYSMPFFYGCNLDARVAPLPSCVSEDNPAQFEPVMYGEQLTKFLSASYDFS